MKKSSTSGATDISQMPKGILDLGRALVQELGLDPGTDTLSRWMAHYIAELVDDAKNSKAKDRTTKMARCADAIIKLWEHRHQLPDGKRPLEDLEPIIRTIESLDPTDNTPRYYRSQRRIAKEAEKSAETRKWLELADIVDHSAKILIRYFLLKAAEPVLDRSKEWAELAKAVGVEDSIDNIVIRFITDENDLLKNYGTDHSARKQLEDRIKRLDGFIKLASALASDLRRELRQSQEPTTDS